MLCVVGVLLGVIPAAIASDKGRDFLGWWILGALFFPIALIAAIVIEPTPSQVLYNQWKRGEVRQCPHCREWVSSSATVCKFCQRDLPPYVRPVQAQPITQTAATTSATEHGPIFTPAQWLIAGILAVSIGVMLMLMVIAVIYFLSVTR